MKIRSFSVALVVLAFFSILTVQPVAHAQGTTAFTYQGQLRDTGTNANGSYNLTFTLYDSPSGPTNLLSGPITITNTLVNGLFTVNLDFGNVFTDGNARWLEIAAQSGTNQPETLSPRVQIMPSPYALYSANAAGISSGNWSAGVGNYQSLSNAFLIFNNGSPVMALTTNASFMPSLSGAPKILQTFTSSGTLTIPSGVNKIQVAMWGAGGGGGGYGDHIINSIEYFATGGGGGAGAYAIKTFSVTPGDSYTVTVGTGGGGGNLNSSGGAGGTTSLSNGSFSMSASGGSGGSVGTTSNGAGGSGGSSSNSTVPFESQNGQAGLNDAGGNGGSATCGGSGGWGNSSLNGKFPGGGGAGNGSSNNSAAGAGANGLVIVYY